MSTLIKETYIFPAQPDHNVTHALQTRWVIKENAPGLNWRAFHLWLWLDWKYIPRFSAVLKKKEQKRKKKKKAEKNENKTEISPRNFT